MILIRGIKGEKYARKIENGIVDCRDILSALLDPPVTGYEFSDYYEKNLVKAITYSTGRDMDAFYNPKYLYSVFIDYYLPHIYLSYFHVLNERTPEWLDKFDDDYKFIAINAKIDKITKTMIGSDYFGAKMTYVDRIGNVNQDDHNNIRIACMCTLENIYYGRDLLNIMEPLDIYYTLAFPLMCREQDDRFTDLENEFRIITYDCPLIENGRRYQKEREVRITIGNDNYTGTLIPGKNTLFRNESRKMSKASKKH